MSPDVESSLAVQGVDGQLESALSIAEDMRSCSNCAHSRKNHVTVFRRNRQEKEIETWRCGYPVPPAFEHLDVDIALKPGPQGWYCREDATCLAKRCKFFTLP